MSEARVKDIQEFVDQFNKDLQNAYTTYEEKQKKLKNLKKCYSQIGRRNKTEGDNFPTVSNSNKTIKIKKYTSNKNIFFNPPVWKPPKGIPDYFEEFKGLKNQYELNIWEKVYIILFIIYIFIIGKNNAL